MPKEFELIGTRLGQAVVGGNLATKMLSFPGYKAYRVWSLGFIIYGRIRFLPSTGGKGSRDLEKFAIAHYEAPLLVVVR